MGVGVHCGLSNTGGAASGASLALSIVPSANPTPSGNNFTYAVTAGNAGPAIAGSVSCAITLDASLAFVSATGTGWAFSTVGQVVTCTRVTMSVATAPVITITVTAGNASGNITTTGAISANNAPTVNATSGATAVAQPVMVATFLDSADPVVTGSNFNYVYTLTNNGAGTINTISAVVTLSGSVTFVSGSGAGWVVNNNAGTVTCTRATLAVGAAPAVTITVTAPGSAQTVTSSHSTTAANAATITGSQGTTVNLVSKDGTSGIFVPATAAEWTNLGLTAPNLLYLCQEASGTLAETITGTVTLASGGTGLSYANVITGWTRKALNTTDATAGRWSSTNAALPDISATSFLLLVYTKVTTIGGSPRGCVQMGTTTSAELQWNSTPAFRVKSGGNSSAGTSNPTGAVRPLVLKVDHTNLVTKGYTDQEAVATTNSASLTGKQLGLGGIATTGAQNCFLYAAAWTGAAAEMSDATIRTMLQTLGWTIAW